MQLSNIARHCGRRGTIWERGWPCRRRRLRRQNGHHRGLRFGGEDTNPTGDGRFSPDAKNRPGTLRILAERRARAAASNSSTQRPRTPRATRGQLRAKWTVTHRQRPRAQREWAAAAAAVATCSGHRRRPRGVLRRGEGTRSVPSRKARRRFSGPSPLAGGRLLVSGVRAPRPPPRALKAAEPAVDHASRRPWPPPSDAGKVFG